MATKNNWFKSMAKVTDDTPNKMRPTKRSIYIQILCFVTGVMTFIAYTFFTTNKAICYPAALSFIIVGFVGSYFEIDFAAFKLSMTSFRGVAILISLFIRSLCRILRPCLTDYSESILSVIIVIITWNFAQLLTIAADSVPRITNLLRFFGPFIILLKNMGFV